MRAFKDLIEVVLIIKVVFIFFLMLFFLYSK